MERQATSPFGACSPIQFLTKKLSRIKNKPYLRIPMLGSFLFWIDFCSFS
ncbi:MAG: hypothetical protein UU40_C0006G0036, partial [Candidatus Uhrbacteria bacterium GW2011_GWD2_41_121]